MRYEDASHTGAFQGSQPVANDDLDSIPAGSRTPATGNLISGEGTQTGSAGADVAPGAHVAAIAGKGGEDTSFSGGKLSVAGEFGHLSVDKDGNYSYQANKGVENVRDRFTYTLADNNGATDTGALIVEVGKTPVVIKAGAQQIVPGPDGVVTLPPGVELSDIMVVGRNLVINMPDGTQMIIVDGAIFVPQLVLGGVEVPSTNLAALLIGQEPQPAAGEAPQSSGGNFETPVPPLDPGVPLGDLIPPTEYVYQPPEPQPVNDILDREPAIQIQPDGQPASVNAVDSVDEDGLPAPRDGDSPVEAEGSDEGADGNPSNNSDTDEATSGEILIDSPDGIESVSINGVLVTGAIGQVIQGDFGTLTITGFNGNNILYTYTLTDNTSGDNTHDDFSVVLTDDDGDTATATLTIDIIDDVPTARDDTDAVIKGETSTDGNVLTGVGTTSGNAGIDTPGADALPNGVTGIHAGTSGSFASVTSGGTLVHGTFGDLVIHADGSYTYTANGEPGPGGNDVFTYQITDGDGDVDTATLTISVPPDSIPVAVNATALVDDDGLPLGNHDSAPGDDTQSPDPDNNESTFGGTLTANFGSDGPGTFTFGSDMDGKVVTIGQEEVTYHVVGNILTAEVSDGARTGTDLFSVTLNADGTYSVQLLNNVLQVDDNTNTENDATAAITFTAHDSDGDVGNGTLTITLDDDIPVARPPNPPEEEGGDPTPLVTGLVDEDDLPAGNGDNAAGDDDPGNADGDGDGTTTGGGAGSLGGLFNAGADAPLTFSLSDVTSGLPTLHSGGALVTYAVLGNVLTASANGSTVFTLTVNADGSWTFDLEGQLDHPTAGTEDNLLLDLSSVIVATDADGDEVGAAGGVFVINVDDDMPSQGEGSVVAHVDEDELPGGITDSDAETTVATGSLAGQASVGADQPGSFSFDASALGSLPALTSGGNAIHYAVVGDTLVAYTGANPAANQVFTVSLTSGGDFTVTLLDQVDHLPNSPANDDNQDLTIDLSGVVQVTDADGDSVPLDARSFIVDIEDDVPDANDDGANAVEGTTLNVNTSLLANDEFGADGPQGGTEHVTSVTHGATTVSTPNGSGDLVIAGTYGTLTIHADGTYSYLATQGSVPPGGATETFSYLITDGDTDTDTATLTINVVNTNLPPSVTGSSINVSEEGLVGGNPDSSGTPDTTNLANRAGSITISDPDGDALTVTMSAPSGSFTSGGEAVNWFVSPDGHTLIGYTGGDSTTNHVVEVTINNAGAYTVNLVQPFDDPNASIEDAISFTIPVNVSDGIATVPTTIVVTVEDDSPAQAASTVTAHVDEDELPGGITDGDAQTTVATGSISALASVGADQPGTFSFDASALGSLPALTSGGAAIHYAVVGGTLVAYTGANPAANQVFTVSLTSDGNYTVTLLDQVDHLPNSPANDDGQNLTIDLSGVVKVTDFDLDSIHLDAGSFKVEIEDDIPAQTASTVTAHVDEDELPNGITDGDAQTTVASGSISALASVGADQPGAFAFDASALGGLPVLTSGGAAIHYAVVGGTLVAYTGANPAANQVFTVTLTSGGNYTVTLLGHIDHLPNSPANDDSQILTLDLSSAVSVTDADGDVIHLDAGSFRVEIEDDIPQAIQPDAASLTNEAGSSVTADLDDDGEVITDFGADGPGLVQFANITNGDDSGFTSGGDEIDYFLSNNGQTLQGRTNSTNGVDGELVFTVQINQATGDYTVTMAGTIDNGAGVSFDDLTSSAAGNVSFRGVGADDPGTTVDLLLSAGPGAGTTVNTDSDSIGAANQSMDNGELVRIDFVTNLTTDTGDPDTPPTGFNYGAHVSTNSFLGAIPQVQGSQSETVAFTVWAIDSANTDATAPDRNSAGGFSDGSITTITDVTVQDYLTSATTTVDVTGFTVGVFTAVAYGISVRVNADGSVTFSGIQQGDHYGFATDGGDFNAVAVQALPAGTGGSSEDSFDLGVFSIGQVQTGDPVDLSFDLKITDADGDTVVMPGAIDITLEPAAQSLAATSFSSLSSESQMQKTAANSNTLTLAAAVAAAGVVETQAAAAPAHGNGNHHQVEDTSSSLSHQASAAAESNDSGNSVVSDEGPEATNASAPADSSRHHSAPEKSDHALDDSPAHADAKSNDAPAANDQGPAQVSADASPVAPTVAMVSAEALQAAGVAGHAQGVAGHAQHGGSVEQIVAEALGHGNASATVDALLNALPGGNGAVGALANLASPAANAVPGGDMLGLGAFAPGHDMMMNMHVAMHHDAVQPVANG